MKTGICPELFFFFFKLMPIALKSRMLGNTDFHFRSTFDPVLHLMSSQSNNFWSHLWAWPSDPTTELAITACVSIIRKFFSLIMISIHLLYFAPVGGEVLPVPRRAAHEDAEDAHPASGCLQVRAHWFLGFFVLFISSECYATLS